MLNLFYGKLNLTKEVQRGKIGELMVTGPMVTQTYVVRADQNSLHKVSDGKRLWHRVGKGAHTAEDVRLERQQAGGGRRDARRRLRGLCLLWRLLSGRRHGAPRRDEQREQARAVHVHLLDRHRGALCN